MTQGRQSHLKDILTSHMIEPALTTNKIAWVQTHQPKTWDAEQTVSPGRSVTLNGRSTRLSHAKKLKKRKHDTHKQEKRKSRRNTTISTEGRCFLTAGLCHRNYTYEDLLLILVCSDPKPVLCSPVQDKLHSPLLKPALQNRLKPACVCPKYLYIVLTFSTGVH